MKFSTDAKSIRRALRVVKGAAGKGAGTIPILKCAKISVSEGEVTIAATDLEVFLALEIPEACADPFQDNGAAVVDIKTLETAVKALDGNVSFRRAGSTMAVETAASSIDIPISDESEWPVMPMLPDADLIRVDSLDGLRSALEAVFHAVSKDETRYNLNGIALETETHATARCIATDGHRLCIADSGPISLPWEGIQIVPLKAAKLLVKLLKASGDCASVSAAGNILGFQGSGYTLLARAIEGEFPNYQHVLPKSIGETVAVDRDALLRGLETASATWNEVNHAIKLRLDGGIDLVVDNPDLGQSETHVDASRGDPETVKEFGFNGRYLQDALKTLPKGTVRFGIQDNVCSAAQLQSRLDAFPLCIVMPMRL